MPKALIVLGLRPGKLAAMRSIRRRGLDLFGIDSMPSRGMFGVFDRYLAVDVWNTDRLLDAVRVASRGVEIAGVVTFEERFVVPAAEVANELGLPGPSPEAALLARRKDLMKGAFEGARVPCARFARVSSLEEARAFAERVGYPCVVKPLDWSASIAVIRADSADALDNAYRSATTQTGGKPIVIESFLEGPEFSVESYTHGGKTQVFNVTDKETTLGPAFVETQHVVPSGLPSGTQRDLAEAAARAIAALGLDDVVCHTEVKLTPAGPHVVEVAARTGGDYIMELVWWARGIDPYDIAVALALGEEPRCEPLRDRSAVIRFVTAPAGRIRWLRVEDAAPTDPDLLDLALYKNPGDVISEAQSNLSRVAHVVTVSDTRELAITAARRAASRVVVEVEPL